MLYQKARPKTLEEVVGNGAAVKALAQILETEPDDRLHVYLFTGPSGCGKTTLARAFADGLADSVEVVERNAASERGIDMARRLEREAQAPPLWGDARAVILDEAHQLTKDAQGALLKVLEDVPGYQYYMLCTTDPQKLLPTIKTRCVKVAVTRLDDEEILDVLCNAAEKVDVDWPDSDDVIEAILETAGGCPRQALVLLEKVQGLNGEDAVKAVGQAEAAERTVRDLCQAVLRKDWNGVLKCWPDVEQEDAEGVRRAVIGYLAAVLKKKRKPAEAGPIADQINELADHTYDAGKPLLLAMLYRATEV